MSEGGGDDEGALGLTLYLIPRGVQGARSHHIRGQDWYRGPARQVRSSNFVLRVINPVLYFCN